MLINYFHSTRSILMKISLLFILFLPVQSFASMPIDMSMIQSEMIDAENSNELEVDTTAATEKKKDKIELNANFYVSLAINLFAVCLIIVFVYYPNYKKMDTIFTFVLFNVVIFLLTFVLNKVKMSMGAAFGLFAVFSMLRYRTSGIGMKDMTYLFIFIALGLMSGIQLEFHELGIIATIIFLVALLLDTKLLMKKEFSNLLRYDKIENVKPEFREQLIVELREKTGLNIHRISINELDYLKDTAMITYYYYE